MAPLGHTQRPFFPRYTTRQWCAATLLFIAYFAASWFGREIVPESLQLFPASALALSILFLEGIALWPAIYLASLAITIASGSSFLVIAVLPLAAAAEAALGAKFLMIARIDPIFRRFRDIAYLLLTIAAISIIFPSVQVLIDILDQAPLVSSWWGLYTGLLFSFVVVVPFMLRWFVKPRFSRRPIEALETIAVFGLLVVIDVALFMFGITRLGIVPLVYFLLIPFFWIALRLRPRFVTLALLLTAIFAVYGFISGSAVAGGVPLGAAFMQIQVFVVAIAAMFLIVASIEEDRRLSRNLMRSQMSTLENAVARISSESKAKNEFIAVLAHELRNPLAPIASSIDLLRLKPNLDPEEGETLAMMDDRMQTVKRLLDDLLDISRISEGKIAMKKETLDVSSVVKRAVLSTAHHFEQRHQALVITESKEHLPMEGDAVRLEQVITNLLTNASKYSATGDRITLSVKKDGNEAEIIVADNGAGIEPESLEHIFIPFHQVGHGAEVKKGLGIGLALVRSFVSMHGGSVKAFSEGRGKGTTFTVRLPLRSAVSANAPVRTERAAPSTFANAPTHGPRVLIIDDNDAAAWALGKLLELRGCTIEYAYDGQQGVQRTASFAPAIILLDLGLPDMDGYAVAKTIRARGFQGRLVALTGYSVTHENRTRGRESGFEHYLVKPASLEDLKQAIPELG